MRGILRLLEGLFNSDPTAWWVLGFTVVGATAIFLVTEWIQKRRKQQKDARSLPAKMERHQ